MDVSFLSPSPPPVIMSLHLGLFSQSDFVVGCIPTRFLFFRAGLYLAPFELSCSPVQNLLASLAAQVLISDLPAELCARTWEPRSPSPAQRLDCLQVPAPSWGKLCRPRPASWLWTLRGESSLPQGPAPPIPICLPRSLSSLFSNTCQKNSTLKSSMCLSQARSWSTGALKKKNKNKTKQKNPTNLIIM